MTIQITGARISGGVHLGGVIPPPTPFAIQYLVVGGGGGGSNGDTPGVPCVPLPCYLGGGGGVVAVSLPTPTYTGNYTGCVAVTTSGCQTVLTFNSPGTYIA
jgi:hypothetical protein